MNASKHQPKGLTRMIYDSMVELTPELLAEGESWSTELLDQVQAELHQRLRPAAGGRQGLIFDLVYQRSFAEARDMMARHGLMALTPELGHPLYTRATA